MKITQKTIDQIEKMQKGGMEDTEIQELLNLTDSVQQTLTTFKQQQEGLLKPMEVAEMLEKGLAKTRQKFSYDKVLRLAREGRLKTAQAHVGESGKLYKRAGILFKEEDVQAFITNGLKTKEELLREVDQLQETLGFVARERDELRKQLDARKEETDASLDFADLIAENGQLRAQIDTLKAKLVKESPVEDAPLTKDLPQEKDTNKGEIIVKITPEIANEVSQEVISKHEKFQPIADKLKEALHKTLFKKRKGVRWGNGSYYKNALQTQGKFKYVSEEDAMVAMLDELKERLEKQQG